MELQQNSDSSKNLSETELIELAKKELLRDIKCASVRAEQFGAHSWAKPQKYVPSKRFLRQMLVNASRDNLRKRIKSGRNRSHRSVPVDKSEKSKLSQDINSVTHSDTNLRKNDKSRSSKSSKVTSGSLEESKKSDSSATYKPKKDDHSDTRNKKHSRWDSSSDVSSYSRSKRTEKT